MIRKTNNSPLRVLTATYSDFEVFVPPADKRMPLYTTPNSPIKYTNVNFDVNVFNSILYY